MKERLNISSMFKLGLTLALFSAAACVMLAFVYKGTEKIIAERQQKDLEDALKDVYQEADNFEPVSEIQCADPDVLIENGYAAYNNGEITGIALSVISKKGYAGPIKILVGVRSDGYITGVRILDHSETPGLGANAASPSYFADKAQGITFYGQFKGKNANDRFEVHDDIAAVTASTITSRAAAEAVKAAVLSALGWFAGSGERAVSGVSEGVGE